MKKENCSNLSLPDFVFSLIGVATIVFMIASFVMLSLKTHITDTEERFNFAVKASMFGQSSCISAIILFFATILCKLTGRDVSKFASRVGYLCGLFAAIAVFFTPVYLFLHNLYWSIVIRSI